MTYESRAEITRFALEIQGRLGLALDIERASTSIATVMRDRLQQTGAASVRDYFTHMSPAELRELAERLTVGETYFFRYRAQFDVLASLLPGLAEARGSAPLRILSAACSSGEEALTIAIVVHTALPAAHPTAASILAVDVNPRAIARAKRGLYSEWSLRDVLTTDRARWFVQRGKELEVCSSVRSMVTFAEKNLGAVDDDLWRREHYDVVFCRNALMYFTDDAAQAVMARIVGSLRPGGVLFLGPTETHLGRVPGLVRRQARDAFYYERLDEAAASCPQSRIRTSPPELPSDPPPPTLVRGIQDASERIVALAQPAPLTPRPQSDTAPSDDVAPGKCTGCDLSRAVQLIGDDRMTEALGHLPPDSSPQPEALVVRAVVLASLGDIVGAERVCKLALRVDPMEATARYVLALCREHVGDETGAISHDHVATYLDPRFAMPHLHLGLLARRRGDAAVAARELATAAALLAEDDERRVVIFGGGLRREALIDLCRAKIRACGADR